MFHDTAAWLGARGDRTSAARSDSRMPVAAQVCCTPSGSSAVTHCILILYPFLYSVYSFALSVVFFSNHSSLTLHFPLTSVLSNDRHEHKTATLTRYGYPAI